MSWPPGKYGPRSLAVLSLIVTVALVAVAVAFLHFGKAVPTEDAKPPADATTRVKDVPETGQGSQGEAPDPWDTPGTHWRLRVTQNALGPQLARYNAPKARVQLEIYVDVLVLPPRHLGDRKIVRMQFTSNAPEDPGQLPAFGNVKGARWVLELDRSSGQVEDLRTQDPKQQFGVPTPAPFMEVPNLRARVGLPVNWMTRAADVAAVPPSRQERKFTNPRQEGVESFEPTRVAAGLDGRGKDTKAVKVTYEDRFDGELSYKLEQTWVPGEPWWRSYKQWEHSFMELEAVRVEDK